MILGGRPDTQDDEVISNDEGDMEDEESDNDGSDSSASTSILTPSCSPVLSQGPSTSTQSAHSLSPAVKGAPSSLKSPLVSFIYYYYIITYP